MSRPYFFQGDLDTAKQLFRRAADSGASAVKLQKRDNRTLFTREMFDSPYLNEVESEWVRFGYIDVDAFSIWAGNRISFAVLTDDPDARGCQLSLRVRDEPKATFERLRAAGVVGDFRPPDVIRLAPVPLYNTFHEIWRFGRLLQGEPAGGRQ